MVHPVLQEKLDREYDSLPEQNWDDVWVERDEVFQEHVNSAKRVDKKNILHKICGDESLPFKDETTLQNWMESSKFRIKLSDCLQERNRTKKVLKSIEQTLLRNLSAINPNVWKGEDKYFTFYSRGVAGIRRDGMPQDVPSIGYTYLITVDDANLASHPMSLWGMPMKYVPAGILLMKPFEYMHQSDSLATVPAPGTTSWRDGQKIKVNGRKMTGYYFFGDITSGMFPHSDMTMGLDDITSQ